MAVDLPLRDRIAAVASSLSPAQVRVARLVDEAPSVVAFGTVAEVAAEADTSPQTVLRLAARLGHQGFPDLQDEVRAELLDRLPPAAQRIRERPGSDLPGEVLAADRRNVDISLEVADDAVAAVGDLLADPARRVAIVVADSWAGIGRLLADQLSQLRDQVSVVDGPPTRVVRRLVELGPGDLLVALDVRRYERWVVDGVRHAAKSGVTVVAISDGPTSPLFADAAHRFVVGVGSPSPFESATGVVALLHLLVTEAAARLRDDARARLDAAEQAWADHDSLLDD